MRKLSLDSAEFSCRNLSQHSFLFQQRRRVFMQRLSNEATAQLEKAPSAAQPPAPPVYPTYGVHNPPQYSPCAAPDCLYGRGPGEPSDPILPLYWTAKW